MSLAVADLAWEGSAPMRDAMALATLARECVTSGVERRALYLRLSLLPARLREPSASKYWLWSSSASPLSAPWSLTPAGADSVTPEIVVDRFCRLLSILRCAVFFGIAPHPITHHDHGSSSSHTTSHS